MAEPGQLKTIHRFIIGLSVVFLLGVIAVVLLPTGIEWQLEKRLIELGAKSAQAEDVDFNPFTGKLVIHELVMERAGKETFNARRIAFDLSVWGLLSRNLHFSDISVDDAKIFVTRDDNGSFTVGGLPLPSKSLSEQTTDGEQWQWESNAFSLNNSVIIYDSIGLHKEMNINSAYIGPISSSRPDTASKFDTFFHLDGGSVGLKGSGKLFSVTPTLSVRVNIKNVDVSWTSRYLNSVGVESLTGDLDTDMEVAMTLTSDHTLDTVSMSGIIELVNAGAVLSTAGLEVRQREMKLEGTVSYKKGGEGDGKISATFTGRGESLQAMDTGSDRQVLSLNKLSVGESTLQGRNLTIPEAEFIEALVLERPAKDVSNEAEPSHIFSVERLDVEGFSIHDWTDIVIGTMDLQDMDAFLSRDAEGNIGILEWFEERDSSRQKETGKSLSDYSLKVDRIDVSGNSSIIIRDNAVSPEFEMALSPFELHIGPLDSTEPKTSSSVAVSAKIGKYASLHLEGDARFFEEKPALELTGKTESIELQKLSAYTEELVGYRATQGQLDVEMQIDLDNNALDADMKILLVKLKMEPVEDESDLFSRLFDISFDKAFSMLRDKQGNVRLRVTVEGDLSDPQFKVRDIIRQALGKAIKKGAAAYFAPLGVTMLTGITLPPGAFFLFRKLLGWATALRFDPVEYAPMEYGLSDDAAARLDKMAALLEDRPDVRVAICGLATLADLRALRSRDEEDSEKTTHEDSIEETTTVKEDAADELEQPSSEESEQLLSVARQRAEGVKDYLVRVGGIDPGRLVLCSPDTELNEKSSPRVEMGI